MSESATSYLNLFMWHMPGLAFMKDQHGQFVYISERVQTLLGKPPEDFLGKTDAHISIPTLFTEQTVQHDQLVLTQAVTLQTIETVSSHNTISYWMVHRFPIFDDSNTPILLGGIALDITEHHVSEKHTRQLGERASALADISQTMLEASLDYESVLKAITAHVARLIGDSCIVTLLLDQGRTIRTVAAEYPNPETASHVQALMETSRPRLIELLAGQIIETRQALFLPTVTPQWIRSMTRVDHVLNLEQVGIHSLLIVPLWAWGRVIGTLGISRDRPGRPYTSDDQAFLQSLADRASLAIENARLYDAARRDLSERTRAERERERFFRLSPDLLAITGLNGTFRGLNRSWEHVLGYTTEELLNGRTFLYFVHPGDYDMSLTQFEQCMSDSSTTSFENRYLCKNGQYRWFLWNVISIMDEELVYVSGRDITDRKQSEDETRQQAVSRGQVGQMLRDLQSIGGLSETAMFRVGYELAQRIAANTLSDYLDEFEDMGLGKLALIKAQKERQRWTFAGHGLVEVHKGSDKPTCNYTRGFLCGVVSRLSGNGNTIGVEIACQSMEDEHCCFEIHVDT